MVLVLPHATEFRTECSTCKEPRSLVTVASIQLQEQGLRNATLVVKSLQRSVLIGFHI
jgi:hypothetical protein